MHHWGKEGVDWHGIHDAAFHIAHGLRKWGRVDVRDWKEKYGTVRVYCDLGWAQLHSITHPGHVSRRYPKWLWTLDCKWGSRLVPLLTSWWILPYHRWLYRRMYKQAVSRYPHLNKEICLAADFPELLVGI